jgi:hypothetical protein
VQYLRLVPNESDGGIRSNALLLAGGGATSLVGLASLDSADIYIYIYLTSPMESYQKALHHVIIRLGTKWEQPRVLDDFLSVNYFDLISGVCSPHK